MAGTFDAAAVASVMSAVKSIPAAIGSLRSSAIFHEPIAAPTQIPSVALWADTIEPIGSVSGLSEVSGRLTVMGRIYAANAKHMDDKAEALLLSLTSSLLGGFAGAFTLGGSVMFVDLLGAYGTKVSAKAGYLPHDGAFFRVAECTFPVIIDPLWTEAP